MRLIAKDNTEKAPQQNIIEAWAGNAGGNTKSRNHGTVEPQNSRVDRIYRKHVSLWAEHTLCTLVCQFIVTCPVIG